MLKSICGHVFSTETPHVSVLFKIARLGPRGPLGARRRQMT